MVGWDGRDSVVGTWTWTICDNIRDEGSDLDNLDDAAEGEGEREEDEHDGDHDQEVGADPLAFFTSCKKILN